MRRARRSAQRQGCSAKSPMVRKMAMMKRTRPDHQVNGSDNSAAKEGCQNQQGKVQGVAQEARSPGYRPGSSAEPDHPVKGSDEARARSSAPPSTAAPDRSAPPPGPLASRTAKQANPMASSQASAVEGTKLTFEPLKGALRTASSVHMSHAPLSMRLQTLVT